jgi:hypothetical protein
MCPYNQNIPQANDQLSTSQADLLNNFIAIQTLINVNHVDFAAGDQGKHKYVTFPVQAGSPPIAFNAGEIALYNFLSPITGQNELYINKLNQALLVQQNMVGSILSTNSAPGFNSTGWTYLPSGILLKWGFGTANGNTVVVYPVAANIPVFTQVFNIQVTTRQFNGADTNTFVRLSNFPNAVQFTVYGSQRTVVGAAAADYTYLAIGI